jgi:polar amino acid transport system substrate-binding protein
VGYSLDVGRLIAAEVSRYLGKPVELEYRSENDAGSLFSKIRQGEVDLACGTQFTWEREMFSDFTIPYALSGIRVLARQGSLDGSPDSLRGRRIGVLAGSLGDTTIAKLQPQARRVPFTSVDDGIAALVAGRVDAVAGDSLILAGTVQRHGRSGYALVPEKPYTRFAVGCLLPEGDGTFRNLANLAIARLLQGYVAGESAATELVGRWVGPRGIVEIPAEMVRAYFEVVLLNHEPIAPPAPTPSAN